MSEHVPLDQRLDWLAKQVVDSAIKVHRTLGPGLLEITYKVCLAQELAVRGITSRMEVGVPVVYEGVRLGCGYRIDLLVEDRLIVEVKAVEALHPLHTAQVLTYLKLSDRRLALLLNFNVIQMKDGIRRIIL